MSKSAYLEDGNVVVLGPRGSGARCISYKLPPAAAERKRRLPGDGWSC
ncbi:MAG TPA: hypothetical protein VL984_05865 [Acidimicrobiales bacterium]|nr:hypothetical protein [Acidimicrobiales bacterium]